MTSKALNIAFEEIGNRQKSTLPTWLLGRGADYGLHTDYIHNICLTLLVTIFYKELLDENDRTQDDLVQITKLICQKLSLPCTKAQAEKIIESLMFSGSKHYKFSFEVPFYDETKESWEQHRFQYFVIDRDANVLDDEIEVYKLSDVAQEIVLKSHEIVEQMDLDMKQLVTELLIQKGNLKHAMKMLDALEFSVRKLINEERRFKDELIKDPRKALLKSHTRWGDQISKVREQFDLELNRYTQMESILRKLEVIEEQRTTFLLLTRHIRNTRLLHDQLAKLVIESIRIEFQILNREFNAMWYSTSTSFRDTLWEKEILHHGFASPDDMLTLTESLLSPHKPLFLPHEWAIDEHKGLRAETTFEHPDPLPDEHDNRKPISLDWKTILSLWEPVMLKLIKEKEVSIGYLQTLDELTLSRWVTNREAFDFWLKMGSLEEDLYITEGLLADNENDILILLSKLIKKNSYLHCLIGCVIYPKRSELSEHRFKAKVEVSNYTIMLKDVL
jgi:hypothetical protein